MPVQFTVSLPNVFHNKKFETLSITGKVLLLVWGRLKHFISWYLEIKGLSKEFGPPKSSLVRKSIIKRRTSDDFNIVLIFQWIFRKSISRTQYFTREKTNSKYSLRHAGKRS